MNKDEEFNPYRPEAIDETKALELTQKDQEFKDSIQGLKDNQEKLDGNYESLGNELKGKSQEDIDNDPGGFHKLREDYDQAGIAAGENREALQQKEGEYEKFKEENGFGKEVDDIDKDKGEAHKARTGRDLDQNLGFDSASSGDNPISPEVGEKAKEAAAPMKDQVTTEQPEQPTQQAQEQTQGQEQPDAPTAQKGNSATFSEISNNPTTQEAQASEKTTEQAQGQTADAPTAQKGNSATMSEMSDKPTTQEAPPQPTPELSRDDR